MQDGVSDERLASANCSPRTQHKSTTGIFGLLTKRSTKVEPHPVEEPPEPADNVERPVSVCGQYSTSTGTGSGSGSLEASRIREHDISFAKCTTPDKKAAAATMTHNHLTKSTKSQTLPTELEKTQAVAATIGAYGSRVMLVSKAKPPKGKERKVRHSSECGSQSDGGEVVLRNKTKKYRSPNHNRFSHQFSLCCRAEKPMTPPVTVRYNSIPDAAANALRRDNLSLSWSLAENSSLSSSAHDNSRGGVHASSLVPLAPFSGATLNLGTSSTGGITECASAPESPVAGKQLFEQRHMLHSSPSSASMKSVQSDAPPASSAMTINTCANGPIRPIAVSACRSRLRLKLYPPGKALPPLDAPNAPMTAGDSIKKATTPQHMSSPNITTQPDLGGEQQGVRFISHDNIHMKRKSSGSGLARQSLMAAHVLSLIPTERARERSFLDGRLGSSSLLGPSELNRILPTQEVTIFVGTWNMNGQSPPKQMNDFVLPLAMEHVPDVVAIGTQESSPDRFEWEVTLQETLGPSHVLFHSNTLGTLHLAIFMRRDLIWYCSAPEDASLSVRTGTAFRTKGAVAISFCLFGTSMLFVTSHLTAHQQKVKERVSDVKRITHALDLPKNLNLRHKNKDVTQNFDNVFWCGDLNFRLSEPREKLLEWIQNTKFPLPSHLPHGYMHTDQLSSVLSDGAAFRGFMEANITFPPTYKYDPGTQHFDTSSKQRAPAYTDRILYKYRQTQGLGMRRSSLLPGTSLPTQPPVECLLYDSVPSIITSDHKPVLALFKVSIRAGTDSIPLAAGLFNRDIYLEGIKRRLNNQYAGSSAVCSIQ